MKIRFAGLICHTTFPEAAPQRQYAALIADAGHTPLISLATAQLVFVSQNIPDVIYSGGSAGDGSDDDGSVADDGSVCIPFYGCLKAVNLGAGLPASIAISEVPSLKEVTVGTHKVNPTIAHCPPNGDVFHGVFELPPYGQLAVDDYYLKQVSFHAQEPHCLPRMVIYRLNTGVGDVTFELNGERVVVAANAEVLISNMSISSDDRNRPSHFPYYKKVFDPEAELVYSPVLSTGCGYGTQIMALPSCVAPQDLNVDCSNTRFP
jgi:hypothetical protein